MADVLCPDCGDPLEDFTPCGCFFLKTKKPQGAPTSGMREMVKRKLARQAADKTKATPRDR